jgi:hypothetical protein
MAGTIWLAGEDLSFQHGSLPSVITTSGWYRAGGFARCALTPPNSGNPCKGNQFEGGAVTSAWLHFLVWPSAVWGDYAANVSTMIGGFGQFSSQNGLAIGCIGGNVGGVANQITLFKTDGSTLTTLATESGTSLTNAILNQFDIELINYGATATVNVYVNGNSTPALSFTGDVTVSGMTDTDCVIFGLPWDNYAFGFSEFIVDTRDTRAMTLFVQYGTAAGDTDDWTGAYSDCNPVTINDANAVYTATAAKDEQFDLNALPAGSFGVLACLIAARASITAGSPIETLKLGWHAYGFVGVDSGHTLSTSWDCYENLGQLSPFSGLPWTPGDISVLQEDLQSAT